MKTLFYCFVIVSLFTGATTSLLIKDSDKITTCGLLEETVLCLKKAIPDYEKYEARPFSVNCKEGKVQGFNIHDMLDTTNYIQYHRGKFKIMPNHLYHVYAWEYAFSTSNLMYVDGKGKITFFEAVSCSNRGNSLEEVEEFIRKTVTDEDRKNELLKVLPSYRDFGLYIQGCGLARILDCEQN